MTLPRIPSPPVPPVRLVTTGTISPRLVFRKPSVNAVLLGTSPRIPMPGSAILARRELIKLVPVIVSHALQAPFQTPLRPYIANPVRWGPSTRCTARNNANYAHRRLPPRSMGCSTASRTAHNGRLRNVLSASVALVVNPSSLPFAPNVRKEHTPNTIPPPPVSPARPTQCPPQLAKSAFAIPGSSCARLDRPSVRDARAMRVRPMACDASAGTV